MRKATLRARNWNRQVPDCKLARDLDGTGRLLVKTAMETKAERYRQRALELRAIAEQMMDLNARTTLLEVAEDYERMAQTAENIARPDTGDGATRPKRPR